MTVTLFMDESGNGGSPLLLVGAVEALGDPHELEHQIVELYDEISARENLVGLKSFPDFLRQGFHAANDTTEISRAFRSLLPHLAFRSYIYFATADNGDDLGPQAEYRRFEQLYSSLVGDLMLRFGDEALHVFIEENSSLRQLFQNLPRIAMESAVAKSAKKTVLAVPTVEVVSKIECLSLAVVDYMMLTVRRWIEGGRRTDPNSFVYRDFREIQPSISVLLSKEDGLLLSRKLPLI